MTQGQPISEYQKRVIRRMIEQGFTEYATIARRAEVHYTTVHKFAMAELRKCYQTHPQKENDLDKPT